MKLDERLAWNRIMTMNKKIENGLKEMTFGEFLVDSHVIDRHQLLCALQMQDRHPGARIGECVAALGFLHHAEVEALLSNWQRVSVVLAS
jgi:hypothetical protein